jgi:hypothetical protein
VRARQAPIKHRGSLVADYLSIGAANDYLVIMNDTSEQYFSETQRFSVWITLLVVLAGGSSIGVFLVGFFVQFVQDEPWGSNPMSDGALAITGGILITVGAGLIWLFATLKLVTEIHTDSVAIRFAPMRKKTIRLDQIAGVEIREFRPIRDFGGWGIRAAKGVRAYLVSGRRGVQLSILDGNDLLIGSQRPEELEAALLTWMKR